ncbi:hypothetical protein KR018_010313, partial [Drosophila ironensis]
SGRFSCIPRQETTILMNAKENTTGGELKQMIQGLLKVQPADQRLYNLDNDIMEDESTQQQNGETVSTAKAPAPAQLCLTFRKDMGDFATLDTTPYLTPPDLSEVMINQDGSNGPDPLS